VVVHNAGVICYCNMMVVQGEGVEIRGKVEKELKAGERRAAWRLEQNPIWSSTDIVICGRIKINRKGRRRRKAVYKVARDTWVPVHRRTNKFRECGRCLRVNNA
jgi:hypothetical protein